MPRSRRPLATPPSAGQLPRSDRGRKNRSHEGPAPHVVPSAEGDRRRKTEAMDSCRRFVASLFARDADHQQNESSEAEESAHRVSSPHLTNRCVSVQPEPTMNPNSARYPDPTAIVVCALFVKNLDIPAYRTPPEA